MPSTERGSIGSCIPQTHSSSRNLIKQLKGQGGYKAACRGGREWCTTLHSVTCVVFCFTLWLAVCNAIGNATNPTHRGTWTGRGVRVGSGELDDGDARRRHERDARQAQPDQRIVASRCLDPTFFSLLFPQPSLRCCHCDAPSQSGCWLTVDIFTVKDTSCRHQRKVKIRLDLWYNIKWLPVNFASRIEPMYHRSFNK